MNKRSFATRKVFTKKPARQGNGKKSGFKIGALSRQWRQLLVWGMVVLNVVLLGSLAKQLLRPGGITGGINHPTQNTTTIEVANGCGTAGIANTFAEALRSKNYDVVGVGNADSFDYETSVLIDRGRIDRDEVEKIASLLGVSKDRILRIENQTAQSDVEFIIGADYKSLRAFRKKR